MARKRKTSKGNPRTGRRGSKKIKKQLQDGIKGYGRNWNKSSRENEKRNPENGETEETNVRKDNG